MPNEANLEDADLGVKAAADCGHLLSRGRSGAGCDDDFALKEGSLLDDDCATRF